MNQKMNEGFILDLFCGGGGASEGIEQALKRSVTIGVNHDIEAIRIHAANHPNTIHLTEDIFSVDLDKYIKGRPVDLMWASPDCRHFSVASGAAKRDKQIRSLPWAVYGHAKKLKPRFIFMENVREIMSWGDLDENGKPIKMDCGCEYKRFMSAMAGIGYDYSTFILNAADYGAPTSRTRWYAVFRNDGAPIVCPEPTHAQKPNLFCSKPWKQCGDYIDWKDLGQSIFDRKKPLADNTARRIARGIQKFVLDNPSPYIVNDVFTKQKHCPDRRDLVAAFLIQYHSEVQSEVRAQSLSEPIKTLDTSNRYALVCPFISKYYGQGTGIECSKPCPTLTVENKQALVSAFLTRYYSGGGAQNNIPVDGPIGTITTKDRFGLVSLQIENESYDICDIRMRMLKPDELKRMQGFPETYVLDHDINGNAIPKSHQIAKVGNSVVPIMARRLVEANCADLIRRAMA